MKPFSLTYFQEGLDTKYQYHKVKISKEIFWRNSLIYSILSFTVSVYSFFQREWFLGSISIFYSLCIIPSIHIILKKYPRFFDLLCFVFQSAIFVSIPIIVFLKYDHEPLQDIESFLAGQSVTYIVISFNLGSRFDLKCLAILINFLGQSAIVISKQKITAVTLVWIVTNLMILYYIYQHDRVEKELFLIKQNQKLWQKEMVSYSTVGIISCVQNQGRLQLSMNRCNLISQQEFNISDLDQLKLLLNNVILVPKIKFNQEILIDMKSVSKSKKYVSLYNQIHNYLEKTFAINQNFIGLFEKSIYDIKIFTTWSDQLQYIHVLMTKSLTQAESEISLRYNYERDLFAQYRQQIRLLMKTILFKQKKLDLSKQFQSTYGSVISDIHNALRISYNFQLFLNPLYEQTKISFLLLPFIEQINSITKDSMPQPFKLSIKCFIDPDLRIFSCFKTIYQIIFNLSSIIIRPAKKSGYVIISAKLRSDRYGTYVSFCIASNLQTSVNLTDYQNYQKSLYGENKGFHFENKNVGLEIIVSEYLIGNVGPRRRIKFENFSQDRQMINFYIYQDLKQIS